MKFVLFPFFDTANNIEISTVYVLYTCAFVLYMYTCHICMSMCVCIYIKWQRILLQVTIYYKFGGLKMFFSSLLYLRLWVRQLLLEAVGEKPLSCLFTAYLHLAHSPFLISLQSLAPTTSLLITSPFYKDRCEHMELTQINPGSSPLSKASI